MKPTDTMRRLNILLTPERRDEVLEELQVSSSPGFDFFFLVVLSCIIATLGLITNSAAVIIGAMLVAPLMSPILGMSLASVAGERRMFQHAVLALVEGILLATLLSALVAWLASSLPFGILQELPGEVLNRTRPNPFDLGIALAGGAAAAYALAQPRISAALPGVAIATALMPPLCTVGIGLALANPGVIFGALLLFVTNLAAISFAGIMTFALLGFRPLHPANTWHRIPRSAFVSALLVLLTTIPLITLTLQFVHDAQRLQQVRTVVAEETAKLAQAEVVDVAINGDANVLNLRITLRAVQAPTYAQVIRLQEALATRLGQAVSIKLTIVPAIHLDPLVPPTPTPTRTPAPTLQYTATPSPTVTASPTATLTSTPTATPGTGYIISTGGRSLGLRVEPAGVVIGYIPEGALVQILPERAVLDNVEWIKVRDLLGRSGWIPAIYIAVIQP